MFLVMHLRFWFCNWIQWYNRKKKSRALLLSSSEDKLGKTILMIISSHLIRDVFVQIWEHTFEHDSREQFVMSDFRMIRSEFKYLIIEKVQYCVKVMSGISWTFERLKIAAVHETLSPRQYVVSRLPVQEEVLYDFTTNAHAAEKASRAVMMTLELAIYTFSFTSLHDVACFGLSTTY